MEKKEEEDMEIKLLIEQLSEKNKRRVITKANALLLSQKSEKKELGYKEPNGEVHNIRDMGKRCNVSALDIILFGNHK